LAVETEPAVELPLDRPKLEAPVAKSGPVLAAATAAAPRPEPSAVRAAGFDGAPVQASGPARPARLNVGSFQGLSGAAGGSAGAGRTAQVRKAAFGGALAGRADGKPGPTVASSGFGAASSTRAPRGGPAKAAAAGFGAVHGEKAEARLEPVQAEPDLTRVEVLSKPKPVYTAEARQSRIEGEVKLEVRFGAGGRIEVLRVLRGLGHGLDEAAARAVEAMRFRPALRGGVPVDSVASVSVAFRLAY
jgi:TonB family protein